MPLLSTYSYLSSFGLQYTILHSVNPLRSQIKLLDQHAPTTIPWSPGFQLGTGINSFTQEVALIDAISVSDDPVTEAPNQDQTYHHTQIQTLSELATALNISASLAVKTGSINASGSGSFINEEKVMSLLQVLSPSPYI